MSVTFPSNAAVSHALAFACSAASDFVAARVQPSKSQSQASLPANHGGGVMTRASAASTVGGARRY